VPYSTNENRRRGQFQKGFEGGREGIVNARNRSAKHETEEEGQTTALSKWRTSFTLEGGDFGKMVRKGVGGVKKKVRPAEFAEEIDKAGREQ